MLTSKPGSAHRQQPNQTEPCGSWRRETVWLCYSRTKCLSTHKYNSLSKFWFWNKSGALKLSKMRFTRRFVGVRWPIYHGRFLALWLLSPRCGLQRGDLLWPVRELWNTGGLTPRVEKTALLVHWNQRYKRSTSSPEVDPLSANGPSSMHVLQAKISQSP